MGLIVVAAGAFAPSAGWAQATAQPTPGTSAAELNPEARVSRPRSQRAASTFAPEPPGPCPLETSEVQVTLNSVSFRGATAVSEAALRGAYAEYLGKPQPVSVICRIRDHAARIVFDHGVLARVEIPEQRIAGGALVLEVIEAHVVNVRVRGDVGPAQAAVERYAEKLRGMKPFDMDRAQRYLLLASDVPGLRVRAAIRPSTSGQRGAVDIDLNVSRSGPSAVANLQNTGSRAVGRWGGLVRAELAGYTGYGESASLTAFHTLDSNEQWLVQLVETARFGSEGLMTTGSITYGESHPGATLKALNLASRSVVANLEVAYPLLRSRTENLNLAGGLDVVDQRTRAPTALGGLLSHERLRVAYARADGDYRTEVAQRPVLLNAGLTVRKGLSILNGSEAGDAFLTRDHAKPEAWVLSAQGGVDVALAGRLAASIRAQAQYSDDVLLPYEKMSLGGLTVGRGYDPAAVLGDKGFSAGFEVRYGPLQWSPKVLASPYAFLDTGYVANNRTALTFLEKDRSLSSVGAGVVIRLFNRANLEITYAHPLHATAPGGSRPGDRVLLQLTANLL